MPNSSNPTPANARKCQRVCPTPAGDTRPLICHQIAVELCMARQREFYHKCHRCLYRGKPADFTHDAPEFQMDPAGVVHE